jgi:hypothetical protein
MDIGIEKEDFLMNKNHLLPALLFVLAACGPATSSSSSVPASSSAAVDNNQYRFIGSQANISNWTPANAPIMTRATGTNTFVWTGDLYVDSTWKLVIGTEWTNGEIGPLSAGLSIIDKGVTWTKDAQGALVIPAASNTGFDPGVGGVGNFKTLVAGNYTVTFVSLPALTRSFTILRNGNPIVPPPVAPAIVDWALVGTINGWTVEDKSFKLGNDKDENKLYSLTLNLYQNEEFKFVKNGAWGGDLGFGVFAVAPNVLDIVNAGDNAGGNIKVVRDGSFTVTLNVGTTTTATVTRVGDVVRPTGGFHLVGTVQTTEWTPGDKTLALTEVGTTGKYYGVFTIGLNKEFKVKTGDTWNNGFDAGFDKVAAFPTGAVATAGGNIKVLVGTAQVPHAFLIDVRVVGSSARLVISPAWSNYAFANMTYAPATGTSISYSNTVLWVANAQLRIYGTFDATKTKVNFEYTGVSGHEYLFKIEGGGVNKEARSIATGAKQTYVLDISTLASADRAKLNLLVLFHTAPEGGSGTLVIHGVSYAA